MVRLCSSESAAGIFVTSWKYIRGSAGEMKHVRVCQLQDDQSTGGAQLRRSSSAMSWPLQQGGRRYLESQVTYWGLLWNTVCSTGQLQYQNESQCDKWQSWWVQHSQKGLRCNGNVLCKVISAGGRKTRWEWEELTMLDDMQCCRMNKGSPACWRWEFGAFQQLQAIFLEQPKKPEWQQDGI